MSDDNDDAAIRRLLDQIRDRLVTESDAPAAEVEVALHGFEPPSTWPSIREHEGLLKRTEQWRWEDGALPAFPTTSRVPGGSRFHQLIGRSVRRDTSLLAGRLQSVQRDLADTFDALVETLDNVDAAQLVELDRMRLLERTRTDRRISGLHERITGLAERIDGVAELLADVSSRLDEYVRLHEFRPPFSSIAYGDRFRGTRGELLDRYHDVADLLLEPGGEVLDLGCGRGELVELIVSKGGRARGVELDPELVEFCRGIFLDVNEMSVVDALRNTPDGSLGGIAMIQVVEHLTAQELVEVVELALAKLKVGGVFVAETVNGTSPFVFTRSFYCDPTHTNPVHHEYLEFLLREVGFSTVGIQWRSLVDEADRLTEVHPDSGKSITAAERRLSAALNDRLGQLNRFLFSPQDYLMHATK